MICVKRCVHLHHQSFIHSYRHIYLFFINTDKVFVAPLGRILRDSLVTMGSKFFCPGRWVGSSKHFLEEEKFRKRCLEVFQRCVGELVQVHADMGKQFFHAHCIQYCTQGPCVQRHIRCGATHCVSFLQDLTPTAITMLPSFAFRVTSHWSLKSSTS